MIIAISFLLIFLILNVVIGLRVSKNSSLDSMTNGGRKMGLIIIIFSTFTTSIGAGDLYSYPSLGFTNGWSSLHYILAMPVVVIIMAFTVGRRYYKMNAKTISDMLCKTYGEDRVLRTIASICMAMGLVAWTAGQYSAFGKSLYLLTGIPEKAGMLIGTVIFVSYTVAGGLSSVMAVSILQGVFMLIGIIVIMLKTTSVGGGFSAIQSQLPGSYRSFWGTAGALTIVTFWMNKGLSRFTNFTYWQKLSSGKNEKVGIWGISLGMAVTGALGVLLAIIGMNAYVLMPDIEDSELIILNSAMLYFPKWFSGILLGVIWAAILSSAGAFLNSASTLIGNDIVFCSERYRNLDGKEKAKRFRIVTAVVGGLTFFVAIAIPQVLDLLFWAGVWLTPPLIPVLLSAVFGTESQIIDKTWITISMAGSALAGFMFELVPSLKNITSGGTIPAFVTSLLLIMIGVIVHKHNRKENVIKG